MSLRLSGNHPIWTWESNSPKLGRASPLISNTLEQLRLAKNYGVIVLAVQHKTGVMQFNPPADTNIEAGDVLIAMGERPKLRLLEEEIGRSA